MLRMKLYHIVKNPTRYTTIGDRVPKGILLCGPSDVGKTSIVNAIANESNVDVFYSMFNI